MGRTDRPGKASINDPAGEKVIEGGVDPVKGLYGGTDDADNSGTLRYVRIEFRNRLSAEQRDQRTYTREALATELPSIMSWSASPATMHSNALVVR